MVKHRMATLAFISWLGFLSAFGQAKHITMSFKNENLSSALKRLEKVSGCKIMFTYDDVEGYKVSGSVKDEDFGGVIQMLLSGKPLEYSHEGNLVNVTLRDPQRSYDNEKRELRGTVISSEDNMPVIGATVRIMGTKEAVVTDPDGKFVFKKWPHGARLVISYIGMTSKNVRATENMRIVLSPDSKQMEEVVVNGTFTRKANTFTGAITSVKGEELQKVGNNNVLQSLKNIDPSFMQIENLGAGSNPNALPDFQMRGASTISSVQGEYASSANQPLFILDGFETELTKILDLDMNQVESITSLKDATAKAIYGSKAANGVIVIETKRPDQGKMRVTYTGSLDVEVPDLSSYDLCNASEKLQVEKMAGLFSSDNALSQITLDKAYANKLRDVLAGVNTDWLAQPVHTGVGHKHSLYLEGGQKDLQYGLNLAYNNIEGAMKGSNRNTFSGGITLSYRLNNLVFRNKLSVDYNSSNNSPYGSFSSYYSMNPYSRLYDENGNMVKSYSYTNNAGQVGDYYNPLYNTTLNTIDNSTYTTINNNFYLEWQISQAFRMTGKFGIIRKTTTQDVFKPANHTDFVSTTDVYRKGSYNQTNGKFTDINAELGLQYSKQVGKHLVFSNAQLSMSDNTYSSVCIQAEGFPNDFMDDITFAVQYAKNSRPIGSEGISRSCGGLLSVNYSYDERYLFDANYRLSGSSETGSQNRWGSFWSVGGGWNAHNEKFIVEMQNAYQTYFKDRALFYSTFPIREQAPKGNEWDFKLNHVYTVALLNFSMNEDAFDKEKIRHHVQLCDTATHKVFYDKLEYIYVEISKFNKPLEELDTLYEKWLYALKNLYKLTQRPKELCDKVFDRLFEEAEIAKFTPQEMREYETSKMAYRDIKNSVDTAKREGIAEGMEKGMELGMAKGKQEGLAEGHVKALKKFDDKPAVYIYNLGTGHGYSVLDVIHAFSKAVGKEIPYVIKPRRAGDIATCYSDATKAKVELGWEAKRNLDDMCRDAWNWQSKNPNGYRS